MANKISKQKLEEHFEAYLTYTANVHETKLSVPTLIAQKAINAITHYDELSESEINLAYLYLDYAINDNPEELDEDYNRIEQILEERRGKRE